jgi:hypothetical protein
MLVRKGFPRCQSISGTPYAVCSRTHCYSRTMPALEFDSHLERFGDKTAVEILG